MTLKPSAQGSLAKTPFAHLLLYVHARKLSGTLAVWPEPPAQPGGQDRLRFAAGQLVAVRPIEPARTIYDAVTPLFAREQAAYGFYEGHDLLGASSAIHGSVELHTLLARGLRTHASERAMDAVLERLRGRALRLRAEAVLETLELSAREQGFVRPLRAGAALDTLISSGSLPVHDAKRILYLLTLVGALETSEGRSEGRASIPAITMESFAPRPLAQGERATPPEDWMERSGHGLRSGTVRPASASIRVPDSASSKVPSGSDASGQALRAPLPTKSAHGLRSTIAPRAVAASAADDARTSSSPALPPLASGLSPLDEARWGEIAALFGRMDTLTHYELLGLAKSASTQEVQAAFYALVKRMHPDRLPPALTPLTRVVQALFERLTEAHETLASSELRSEYDKAVASGGGTRAAERTLRNVLEASVEFQKAEVLVRRRDYEQALQLLQSALAKNPDDADYHALYAWILHLTNPGQSAPLDVMLRALDRALKSNPQHERAHYYRGVVLKRLKRDHEAVRHFKVAAELNPHNVEAAREVRLATLRRESRLPPPGPSGVLARLFKK